MKIIFYFTFFCLISVAAVSMFLYFEYSTSALFKEESWIKIELVEGRYRIKLPEMEKEAIKSLLRGMAKKIYYEAAIHNPSGDILPDSLDDMVIGELKERIE